MKGQFTQRIQTWVQGRAGRFLLVQLAHTSVTIVVLAALLAGAARAGALNSLMAPAAPAAASSFTTVNYQGRLADAGGNPVNNTNPGMGMTFALYAQESGGSAVWSETHANVPVSNGLFSVRLGSISALSTDSLTGDRWLGVRVGTDPEMAPREKLAAVPYAMMAGTVVDGAITTAKLASHLCCGHTDTNGTGWVAYGIGDLYIDVNTSACNFSTTPMYFTSIRGDSGHYATTGPAAIYSSSPSSFRVYLASSYEDLDPTKADIRNWYIQWCGVKE